MSEPKRNFFENVDAIRRSSCLLRRGAYVCGCALVFCLVASFSFAAENSRFRVQTEFEQISFGSEFRVGLVCDDPQFDLTKIVRMRFEITDERWNVTEPWTQVTPDDAVPAGWIWRASLQGFDLDNQPLPGVTIVYSDERGLLANEEAETPTVLITGVIPQNVEPASKPARGVVDISTPVWPYVLALVLICVAALVIYLMIRRNRLRVANKGSEPTRPRPTVSALDWALAEIERRRNLEACVAGESKVIVSLASDVIRDYLERRFAIAALEMTTYECMQQVQGAIHHERLIHAVGTFLDECDLVKFAKVPLPQDRWQAIWDDAIAIVRISQPQVFPAEDAPDPSESRTEGAGVR